MLVFERPAPREIIGLSKRKPWLHAKSDEARLQSQSHEVFGRRTSGFFSDKCPSQQFEFD